MITTKAQLAISGAIEALALEWPAAIRAGISNGVVAEEPESAPQSIPLPCVVCNASSSTPIDANVAIEYVDVEVYVRHNADDSTPAQHQANALEILNFIRGSTFLSGVNAYPDFTAFGVAPVSSQYDIVGRRWQTTFNFRLLAAPSTIT